MEARPDQNSATPDSAAPRSGLILMAVIVVALALLSIYLNIQKTHRDQIETVTITPAEPAAAPGPSASP